MMQEETIIKLTQFSHGAGCGCKIAPQVLDEILKSNQTTSHFPKLLVGNGTKDDAAAYQLNDTEALISTTDFFTPIVDDAYIFGQVAAANAISDVYAMGGTPIMALAILGWPVDKLPASLAQQVLEGARSICELANIPLAGGHSIDTPEPIFGLSVNGLVPIAQLKKNDQAQVGDVLLLTKPIGVGILSTAAKRGAITEEDLQLLYKQLVMLNKVGAALAKMDAVHAMTDVTGFGLAGHLVEMAEGAGLSAILDYEKIPKIASSKSYMDQNIIPDATYRNWNAYSAKIAFEPAVNVLDAFKMLPDPQTNGGLLIAVHPDHLSVVQDVLKAEGLGEFCTPIGHFVTKEEKVIRVQ